MKLSDYEKKRHFDVTPEPQGSGHTGKAEKAPLIYVIQKHFATNLHYDFRLEWQGALLSWAVPKGPSLDPGVKRLAMQAEDHPVEYAGFEGVIPAGQYGGGTVMLWDRGTWKPDSDDVGASLDKGELKFTVKGKKLKGSWVLVRTRGFGKTNSRSAWLLIKHRDQYASAVDVLKEMPRSVESRRLLVNIAEDGGGDSERASQGDPAAREVAAEAMPAKKPSSSVRRKTSRARMARRGRPA